MALLLIPFAVVLIFYLFHYAKQIKNNEKQNFLMFHQENYENKELYSLFLSRGIRLLALYLGNTILVTMLCILSNQTGFYLFALIFFITTISIWYANMIQMLSQAKRQINE